MIGKMIIIIIRLNQGNENDAEEEKMNDRTKHQIMKNREVLKGYSCADIGAEDTDQKQKISGPIPVKVYGSGVQIQLPTDFSGLHMEDDLNTCIRERRSRRTFAKEPVSLTELAYLLWATQGIRRTVQTDSAITFRNVPSAGSRHPLETYLFLNQVEGIQAGLYHYRPDRHLLEKMICAETYTEELKDALCGQIFAATAPGLFVWSAVPYRCEWRYGLKAAKYILLDAGHVCENLYLAAENIGLGVCAVGAYDQDLLDELLGFVPGPSADPEYECAVYVAAVGKNT